MGVSSDGDPRLLSAMVHEASLLDGIVATQDIVHICTKSRNRLLKPDIKLSMGNKKVSIEHLRQLLKVEQKSVHKLIYSDVFPIDRMNFKSFEKIVDDCVIDSLRKNVPSSEATVHYLLTFRDISDSFSKLDLKPLQRIFLLHRSLYFLRIWRLYIKNSPYYNLDDNFISLNLYKCVELNAKALVRMVKICRDNKIEKEFLPCLFDSQTCERFFRLLRSMGTTNFTRVNFDLLDLIYMINRIEIQNDITYSRLNLPGIEIPNKRESKTTFYKLPTDTEISDIISKAKKESFKKAEQFGMTSGITMNDEEIEKYEFKSTIKNISVPETEQEADYDSDYDDLIDSIDESTTDYGSIDEISRNQFDEFGAISDEMDKTLNENSPLVHVVDINGEKKLS